MFRESKRVVCQENPGCFKGFRRSSMKFQESSKETQSVPRDFWGISCGFRKIQRPFRSFQWTAGVFQALEMFQGDSGHSMEFQRRSSSVPGISGDFRVFQGRSIGLRLPEILKGVPGVYLRAFSAIPGMCVELIGRSRGIQRI